MCEEFDCDKGVLRRAISLAVYLGFKTIYLVGCDYLMKPSKFGHWYEKVSGFREIQESYIDNFINKLRENNINFKLVVPEKVESDIDIVTYEDLFNCKINFKRNNLLLSEENMRIFKNAKYNGVMKNILITGGAGFIGSHVVRKFVNKYPEHNIFNLDALTYAGNLQNLKDLESKPNYNFIKGDITNEAFINNLFKSNQFEGVIHLAAESHVDRSIIDPIGFAKTNILGTIILLNAFKTIWNKNWNGKRFYHVSTDEVYGSLGTEGLFSEKTPYDPNSPYSASKASSDHFVRAYGETYGMPYVISNCSNNYGAKPISRKLIPLFINNIINNKSLPVYGDGNYTRDWLFVEDHAHAIDLVFDKGLNHETYNIGGFNEWKNIDLIKLLL